MLAIVAVATVLLLVALRQTRGVAPVGALTIWVAAFGSEGTGGLPLLGAVISPMYILLFGVVAVLSAERLLARTTARPSSGGRGSPVFAASLFALATGLLAGNSIGAIRTEFLLFVVLIGGAFVVRQTCRNPVDLRNIFTAVYVASTLAALKSFYFLASAPAALGPGSYRSLNVASVVNESFGAQRVIPVGGDTLLAVGIPLGVLLLADARRWRRVLIAATLPLCALALMLTYTRTLLAVGAAAAVAAAISTARTKTGATRRGRQSIVVLLAAILLLTIPLLFLKLGSSEFTVGSGVARRFAGGASEGSGGLEVRFAEGIHALAPDPWLHSMTGRGFGSTYFSPLVQSDVPTTFTHVGVLWVLMKGGFPLLATVVATCVAALVRNLRLGRRLQTPDGAVVKFSLGGANSGIAVLLAANMVMNRFATVEGMLLLGLFLGVSYKIEALGAGWCPPQADSADRALGGRPVAARG